jgi:flagellar biosynthesis protein FliQ
MCSLSIVVCLLVSRLQVMEQVIRLSREIEDAVVSDLDRICELSGSPVISQLSDEIRMNVSSMLTEMRFYITNKVRLKELVTRTTSEIIRLNSVPVVFIIGKVTQPGTARPKAMAGVYWNEDHALNTCIVNPTNSKTLVSSNLVAILVATTQIQELGGKAIHILTTSPTVKSIIDHLPLTHIQGYKDTNRQAVPNASILKKIYLADISLIINHNPEDTILGATHTRLGKLAKRSINVKFNAQ